MTSLTDDPTSAARRVRRRRFVAIAVTAVTLDLTTKAAASHWLTRRVDLPGPLDLQLAHNPGVAFGLGDAVPAWLTVTLTACVATFLGVAAWRGHFASTVGAGLVSGGALANLADRLQAGTVVDMFHLGWWPTFNLADVCITIGAALLIVGETRTEKLVRQ